MNAWREGKWAVEEINRKEKKNRREKKKTNIDEIRIEWKKMNDPLTPSLAGQDTETIKNTHLVEKGWVREWKLHLPQHSK